MNVKVPKGKLMIILLVPLVYILFSFFISYLVITGNLQRLPPTPQEVVGIDSESFQVFSGGFLPDLEAAQIFVSQKLMRENGHIDLYYVGNLSNVPQGARNTNSEAASYYLLWSAKERDKEAFDKQLDFIEKNMIHPTQGYMMWRLEPDDAVIGDGSNIATDADLRMIKALLIAEEQWGDKRYTQLIDKTAASLEKIAVTQDQMMAPYGGASGETGIWKTEEVWLSYTNFEVYRALALRRGEPWRSVYYNMRGAVLNAQLSSGVYNTRLDSERKQLNLDEAHYSINSLWVMVRAAESKDPELQGSAKKSLEFYKRAFARDGKLFTSYDGGGIPASDSDSPWVYALVGRAAVALADEEFSTEMMRKLAEFQDKDPNSELYGAFLEGFENESVAGQFTNQESILTIQDYRRLFKIQG